MTRNLAWFNVKKKNYEDAEVYKRKEVGIRLQIAKTQGYSYSDLCSAQYGLAKILRKRGKDEESMMYYRLARDVKTSKDACTAASGVSSNSSNKIFKP